MVKGIESNVVDGQVSWRALPTDPPGTEENGSFLLDGSESHPFSCENARVSTLVRHLSHAQNRIWNVCHLPELCLIS